MIRVKLLEFLTKNLSTLNKNLQFNSKKYRKYTVKFCHKQVLSSFVFCKTKHETVINKAILGEMITIEITNNSLFALLL